MASDHGGEIYALERATGAVRWHAAHIPGGTAVGDQRPVAGAGQLVLAGSSFQTVTAFDAATGLEQWKRTLVGSLTFPITSDLARAYLVELGGRLVALDLNDGSVAWTFGGNGAGVGPMQRGAAVRDGIVYIGGSNAAYALRAIQP